MVTSSLLYRPRQGLAALFGQGRVHDTDVPVILSPAQEAAFLALPRYDQAHLLAVYRRLVDAGVGDDELLLAAILHDIGKVGFGTRVRLHDRVVTVLLRRLSPALLARLARLPATGWRRGLALAVHHPHLGATIAAGLGCSERTCWLIAHHADAPPHADPDLRILVEADHAAVSVADKTCPDSHGAIA